MNDLKIIRVFSKSIERREFPGPLLNNAFQHLKNEPGAECKTHHRPFALHHLVRERNPRISELEEHFRRLQQQGRIASALSRSKYNTIVQMTEFEVLKERVDIILCTCNEVSSYRMINSVIPAYCIVDECAMATEPDFLIPIR